MKAENPITEMNHVVFSFQLQMELQMRKCKLGWALIVAGVEMKGFYREKHISNAPGGTRAVRIINNNEWTALPKLFSVIRNILSWKENNQKKKHE